MRKFVPFLLMLLFVLSSCILKNPPKIKVEGTPVLGGNVFLKVEEDGFVSWDLDDDGEWDINGISSSISIPLFCDFIGSKRVTALVKSGWRTWKISKMINISEPEIPVLSLKGGVTKNDEITVELVGTKLSIMGLDVLIDYDRSSLTLENVLNVSSGVLMPVIDDRRITVGFLEEDLESNFPTTILKLTFSIQKKGSFDIALSGSIRNSLNEDVNFLNFGTRIVRY